MNAPASGTEAMSDVLAWLAEGVSDEGRPWKVVTYDPAMAQIWNRTLAAIAADEDSRTSFTVTPLVAAPPEGAPSWREIREAVGKFGRHTSHCALTYWRDMFFSYGRPSCERPTCDCGLAALLSRIPKEEA